MRTYILRRLLLMPFTLIGVTFIVFCVTRFVPGGPIEQQLQQQSLSASSGKKAAANKSDAALSEEDMERLEEQYGLQEPLIIAYLQWIGLYPQATLISKGDFLDKDPTTTTVLLSSEGKEIEITRDAADSKTLLSSQYVEGRPFNREGHWKIRIESPVDRAQRWGNRMRVSDPEVLKEKSTRYHWRAVLYQQKFNGLLQGTFGVSFKYNESVWDMMTERMPISIYFGLLSALITYGICIPLGIAKAIHHRSSFDNLTSIVIFIGYSIPGFALGAILVVYLGTRLGWFPISGLTSSDFDSLTPMGKVLDIAHHTVLPLICYVIGSFALLTMMMKNNLMDNLSADYVRTAMSKGVVFKKAVFNHAFRNSFIPIASTLGGLIGILVTGSMLVERMFDIQGFGMLSYQAVLDKDYSLIMGTLTLSAFLMILGSLISDIIVSLVDPRIKFE